MMFTSNQWVLGLVLLQHVSSAISSSHGVGDNAASFSTPGVADLPRRRKITNRARRSADDDGQHNHNRDLGIGSHATVISDAIQTMNKINRIYPTTRGGDGGTGEDAILGEMFPGDARDAGNDTGMGKGKGGSKAPKASKAPTASKAPKASKAPTVSKAPKAACSGKGKGGSSGTKTPTVSKAPKASKAPSGGSKAPKASIRCTEEPSMQPSSEPSKIPTKVPTTGDDTTREDNGLPDEQSNDDSPPPMCGRQANGATCENDLCCSEHGYCGDSYEYCSMGCQSGACYAHHGENIMPADPEGGEGKQNTGGDESKGEATSPPICGGQAGDAICLNEMCCSSHGYCGNGVDYCGMGCQSGECYENHHGDNVMLKDPEEGHGQNNEPATGGEQEEMGQGGTEITKDIHHGTGFGDGVGMYAVCLEPEASISNDELRLAVDSEVIVSYQYALNIEPGANLDEVLTFAELQLHNLLVEEKMDCSQVGRRKLQGQFETQCYPQAVVSSPGEVELSNAVCQESEALEGKICRIIAGGFGLFLGSEGGCSVFAYDQIKQIYLQWVKDKMTEESRTSGVPVAIENVPGAAGVVFRGAISDEYRQPSVGGSVSGFKSLATGQDDDDNSITSLGGFFIGFICAGTVAIAYLVTKTVRERRRKPDQDEEYMLEKQESKDLNLFDLEEDLNTSTGSSSIEQPDGVLPSPTASNTGVKFVRVDDEYYNFDHDYGIDTRRLGAEPRLADSYLFDRTLQDERSQNHEGHHSPGGHKKPHFCNSQLCGICCGTVATPHQSGGLCCDIPSMSLPSPAARNNTLQPRNYTTPDTIEF